jgi:DNA-binding CsgD family transcriptional regulator
VQAPGDPPRWSRAARLTGRRAERAALVRLAEAVREGESQALVVTGEAGIGKTALLDYLAGHAEGCRVVRAAGVQSEMELAFSGLHQLCAPMLDRLGTLPEPQQEALGITFGLTSGPAPDRFLVGLAALSLLSAVAERQPLICLIDDQQWLDQASAQILAFVARRLGAESVGMVFAARTPTGDLAGLPRLVLAGLPDAEARTLLDSALSGPLDRRVRDQIVAEAHGNPLALLELPRGLTLAELAGGFGLPGALPLAGSIEDSFRRRVAALPAPTRMLLLLAAADPTGDPALVWRAAGRLGIETGAAAPLAEADLAEFGTRVRFRHPLARSAAYQSASARQRQQAHQALAQATDPGLDPDRRTWHLARAATGPDEALAAELEHCAGRARARGGLAAAAAFLKQAAMLTADPARRAGRALAAAQATIRSGELDEARDLLDLAAAGPLGDLQQAEADLARAQLAFVARRGSDAPPLLLKAARRLEPIDPDLSRATYLDAVAAAIFAAGLASPGGGVREVARAAAAAPPPRHEPRAPDLLLDGTVAGLVQGPAAGVPVLRQALKVFTSGPPGEADLRWMWLAASTAMRIWDYDGWAALSVRYVELARQAGALSELPLALTSRTFTQLFAGELTVAAALAEEVQAVTEATRSSLAPYGALGLAALRGDESTAAALIEGTIGEVTRRGEGVGITFAEWASAVLRNGLGQYQQAAAAAQRATAFDVDLAPVGWALVELIEAAARSELPQAAAVACDRLCELTDASRTDWALGTAARSRALLSDGDAADELYRESIDHLGRTRMRVDLARARLLYGEWLRRERRRTEARDQLRAAHAALSELGLAAFAERARRELEAAGEVTRERRPAAGAGGLTAQEALIARLARDGLSNPEIGTRLFISAHTVQYHLRKVFTKLGISSRSQLDRVLPAEPPGVEPP